MDDSKKKRLILETGSLGPLVLLRLLLGMRKKELNVCDSKGNGPEKVIRSRTERAYEFETF